jgi:hypothetical protein
MRKRIVASIAIAMLILNVFGCGKKAADIIETYSEEATVAGASREDFPLEAVEESTEEEIAESKLPEGAEEFYDELQDYSIKTIKELAESCAPDLDVTGCETFTQIIDNKFTSGMAYANENILDADVFFVSNEVYSYEEDLVAATDATLYIYKDNEPYPYEIGKVVCGGTAYPLTINNGYLYCGSNRWICKYAIANDKLMIMEKACVCYGEDGSEHYFYESEDGGDYSNFDNELAENIYHELLTEMGEGTIIPFSVVN